MESKLQSQETEEVSVAMGVAHIFSLVVSPGERTKPVRLSDEAADPVNCDLKWYTPDRDEIGQIGRLMTNGNPVATLQTRIAKLKGKKFEMMWQSRLDNAFFSKKSSSLMASSIQNKAKLR